MPKVNSAEDKTFSVSDLAEIMASKHRLGKKDELTRQLRYFTTEGLLETVSTIHTGSGRKRLYSKESFVRGAILSRLFESGATVGLIKSYMAALDEFNRRKYQTTNLLVACSELQKPTVYLVIPDQRYKIGTVGLFSWTEAVKKFSPNVDFIAIQIGRFL